MVVTITDWPNSDLVWRVERALDLAAAAISLVAAQDPGIDLEALDAPPDKVIAETAMFLRVAMMVPGELALGIRERAHELTLALLPHVRHPRVAIGIALHPALARDYGAAHIVLTKAGYPDPQFDRVLAAAITSPTATARERLPHRQLEQAWLISLAGGPAPPEELIARTALVRGIDLLTGSRDDVYALTHTILYATDFGNLRLLLPISDADVLATASSALAGALDDDDFDLAGELLLTWPFLYSDWDSSSSFAFSVLSRIEDEVGVLPSLSLNREGYNRQAPTSRKHYITALAYHTSYVMGLLCSAILRRCSHGCTLPPASSGSITFARELLSVLINDEHRPQWLRNAEALPDDTLASCSSFFLDVALRRAVRKLDLAMVRHFLQTGVDHGLTLSPLCVQAAGILRRLAGLSNIIWSTC